MRKNIIKSAREEKTPCWKETKQNSNLKNKIPVFYGVDDEEYFFEVEDF